MRGEEAVVVALGPLAAHQAVDLVAQLVAAAPGPRLRRLAGQAGGNPLYLRELVDALLRDEGIRVAAGVAELVDAQVPRPVSLTAAIGRRLRFLSEPTTAALQLAALLGPEFATEHLRVVTGRTGPELTGLVQEAVAAGVLAETGSGDRLAFRHGLIRQALYDEIPAPVRAGLHRHAAQTVAGAWVLDWVTVNAPMLIYRAPLIAVELLGRVRDLTDAADPRRESLDTSLVTAQFLLGRNDDAEQ